MRTKTSSALKDISQKNGWSNWGPEPEIDIKANYRYQESHYQFNDSSGKQINQKTKLFPLEQPIVNLTGT